MDDTSLALSWGSLIVTLISPIIVALIGLKANRIQKETKRIQELTHELEENKQQELNHRFETVNANIDALEKTFSALKADFDEYRDLDEIESIKEQLKTMIALVNINFETSQNLSRLCSVITDMLCKYYNDPDMQTASKEFKHEESELASKIYKVLQ